MGAIQVTFYVLCNFYECTLISVGLFHHFFGQILPTVLQSLIINLLHISSNGKVGMCGLLLSSKSDLGTGSSKSKLG